MADPRLASILDRSADAATVAWAHSGQGDLAQLPDPELAIAAAAELGNVAALQAVTAPKSLRKAAAAALHKLRSRGVKVADAPAPVAFTLAREVIDVPPRAFLGAPNAIGNCHLLLTATDRDNSCIMEVIFGGDKVQDSHGHASRSELRKFWKEIEGDATVTEVPFLAGLHLADALVRGKHVHGWDHFISKVDPSVLASARLADPTRHALPEGGAEAENFVLPAWLVPAKVVDAVVKNLPNEAQPGEEGWIDTGVQDALADGGRETFAAAADRIATVYQVLGRAASAELARAAARRLRNAGDACADLNCLRSAVLMAAFQELQHRQQEQQADMDALMQRLGSQREE